MKVSIQCFGQLRTITKERYVHLDVVENSSVLHVLSCFRDKYGEQVDKLLYREGKIRDFYFIQVDKLNVDNHELNEITVTEKQHHRKDYYIDYR